MTSTPLPSVSRATSAATSVVVAVDGLVGAEGAHALAVVGAADGGQHPRSARVGELHCGAADTARCALDQHGLAGGEGGAAHQAVPGGREGESQRGRLFERAAGAACARPAPGR